MKVDRDNYYDNKDYLDIQDFITTTLELQEETYKAQQDLEDEYVDAYFTNKFIKTQKDLLEDKDEGYIPNLYSL